MNTQVSFTASRHDYEIIGQIVTRAKALAARVFGEDLDSLSLHMDLIACHANGMPLRLTELSTADDENFAHDVFGIRRHIDRDTGRLRDFLRAAVRGLYHL